MVFHTANPTSPGHWLAEAVERAEGRPHGFTLHFHIDDNPHLPAWYKSDLYDQYGHVPHLRSRYIDGLFCAAEGLLYPYYETREDYDPEAPLIIAIDPGPGSITAALYAKRTPDKKGYVVFDEYYHDAAKSGPVGEREHVSLILARHGMPMLAIYDHASASLRYELQRQGATPVRAQKDLVPGIVLTDKRLRNEQIYIAPECYNLRKELAVLEWDAEAAVKGEDKPARVPDHAADALRYLANCSLIWGGRV